MWCDYRDELARGHSVEPCPYCGEVPRFRQWPCRSLVIFAHKCRFVANEATLFPDAAPEAISDWNEGIQVMKANALKGSNVELSAGERREEKL